LEDFFGLYGPLDLTRSSCKKCNRRSSGRNRTCGAAIPRCCATLLGFKRSLFRKVSDSMRQRTPGVHESHLDVSLAVSPMLVKQYVIDFHVFDFYYTVTVTSRWLNIRI
jgi:hypothetical protein